MKVVKSPAMLSVRGDRPAGVIRAYLVVTPETEASDRREIGTLSIHLADAAPWAFELWKEAMTRVVTRIVEEATGLPVAFTVPVKPHEKN